MKSAVLAPLLDSPALPELLEEARRVLAREHLLRQKFYAEITPEHKWEFIQGEIIMHSPSLNRHLMATKRLFSVLDAHVRVNHLGIRSSRRP